MLYEDTANPQANEGADNTAEQMNDDDLDLDSLDQIKDPVELRNKLKTTVAQKQHWRDKHHKLAEDPRLKEPEAKPEPKPAPKKESKKDDGFDPDEFRREVREETLTMQKYPNMTDDELTRAKKLAKAEGRSLVEMVEDPYFQAYLKDNETKRAADKARPSSSQRNGNSSQGSVSDLSDPEKVKNMSPEEFKKLSDQAGTQSRYKFVSRS